MLLFLDLVSDCTCATGWGVAAVEWTGIENCVIDSTQRQQHARQQNANRYHHFGNFVCML